MGIFLVLIIVAAAVILTLVLATVGSLVFGGLLLYWKSTRFLTPVFFLIIPGATLGSLAGGWGIGYWALRANHSLILFGPLAGLVVGGIAGLFLGLAGAVFWWWRGRRAAKQVKSAQNCALAALEHS